MAFWFVRRRGLKGDTLVKFTARLEPQVRFFMLPLTYLLLEIIFLHTFSALIQRLYQVGYK